MTDVAAALVASRAAHLAAKVAVSKGLPAPEQWQAAFDKRLEAAALDPDHADPAWLEDALHPKMPGEQARRYHRIPGKSSADVAREKDTELLAYFRQRLAAAAVGDVETLTEEAIRARVVVPQAWSRVVEADAEVPPCKPHLWVVTAGARTCSACGAQEQLVDKVALEETQAFQQLVKEQAR